jgi:hypothetical protein
MCTRLPGRGSCYWPRHRYGRRRLNPRLRLGQEYKRATTISNRAAATDTLDQFELDHLRLYFSGDITKDISAMVNTDYSSSPGDVMQVLDAVGEFHTSPMFNIWFGRFLPPSDRDNYTGPFYANLWAMYHDGIQDGYPSVYQGRDNGIAYWGDFKAGIAKIKVSVGAFDGGSLGTGSTQVLAAGRVQIDFWDPEKAATT